MRLLRSTPLVALLLILLLGAVLIAFSAGAARITPNPSAAATPTGPIPALSHVFVIVLENTAFDDVVGNKDASYLNTLAHQYAMAEQYYGVAHPSLPNYLALIGGDTFGIASDCTDCFVNKPNLVDQLEANGKSWKAYIESMPNPCFVGDAPPLYRQKHNPFIYFDNIRNDPERCGKLVPFTQFQTDLAANTLPNFVWITPNMCHSTHDCSLQVGDEWLHTWVDQIIASPAWRNNGVLFITYDEGNTNDKSGCCTHAEGGHIVTLVISPLVKPGYRSPYSYSHYSLLRTIEAAWGLPLLGRADCDCSPTMADFFTP